MHTHSRFLRHSLRYDFTVEEIRKINEILNNNKGTGEDVINGEVFESAFHDFPKCITTIHNACVRKVVFPRRWKTAQLLPIVKAGKEIRNFFSIILLSTGGNVLEKLFIIRINHHILSATS